jgi:hypothetical protein
MKGRGYTCKAIGFNKLYFTIMTASIILVLNIIV